MADNVGITEGSGKTIGGDEISSVIYQRIKLIYGADGTNDGDVSSANPLPVTVNRVTSLVDGTVTVGTVNRVNNVVDGTLSTIQRVQNVVDGTLSTVQRVQNLVDGTLSTVQRVQNVVDGTLSNIYRVHNVIDGTINARLHALDRSGAWEQIRSDGGVALGAVRVVHAADVATSMNITNIGGNAIIAPNAGIQAINIYATASIFTVSGSTSGGTTSGVTLVAPSASYNFKVYTVKLTTTAQVANVWRLVNGSGASQTEFWRAALQAPTQGIAGIVDSVDPPAHLFATGTSTTLALHSDAGSLVHYTVSYIKESA